ncbi:MAG: hypothetical protein J5842_01090 [Lachnospiraceae bacterium]|nr:hypothetical protein [Lachnospiraceae bacterium]
MQYDFRGTYISHKRLPAFLTVNCVRIILLGMIIAAAMGIRHYGISQKARQAYEQEVNEAIEKGKDPAKLGLIEVEVSKRASCIYAMKRTPLWILCGIIVSIFVFNLSGYIYSCENLTDAYGLPQGIDVICNEPVSGKRVGLWKAANGLCKKTGGYLSEEEAGVFLKSFCQDDKKLMLLSESLSGSILGYDAISYGELAKREDVLSDDIILIIAEMAGGINYRRFTAHLKSLGSFQQRIVSTMVIS